jgi:type IV secretory pathway VirB2 component (pilin)
MRTPRWLGVLVVTLLLALPHAAHAAGGGQYAWETTSQKVLDSLTGPMAAIIGTAAVFMFGVMLAMSDGGGLGVILKILVGLSVAFTASGLIGTLFGFGGGMIA